MKTVLLTDFAWPDFSLERGVIGAAGHRFVAGPAVAGTDDEIAALAARYRPNAIMTCWAPVRTRAIAACPDLRIIARMGVGLDNIAIETATAAGAWVTNVPDYCVEEVSDHTVGLLLTWARGIAAYDAEVKKGLWNAAARPLRRVRELTAGIIGLGRIGMRTADKLHAFGMRVLAADPTPPAGSQAEIVSLGALLADADVLILHLPLIPSTQHFVDRDLLSKVKKGAFLINVSRGALVDSEALLAALDDGRLAGAALDVVEGEPTPPACVVARPDVIATPHVAFSSESSVRELRLRAAEEVVRVLAGEPPIFPCNTPLLTRLGTASTQ